MTKAGMEMATVRMTKIKSHHLLYESNDGSDWSLCSIVYFGECLETRPLVQFGWITSTLWYWLSKTNRGPPLVSRDSTLYLRLFRLPLCYSVMVYKGKGAASVVSAIAT
jgi:hypothetical protein